MPVAKTNDPGSLLDYRLELVSCQLCPKQWKITAHIERNGMMIRLQPGFRSNHNTTTALLKNNEWPAYRSREEIISILVLLDFSKAFDSVDHQFLCSKLCQYKFSTSAVDLIRSNVCEVLPVWGPLLFWLFINERHCIISLSPECRWRTTLHQLPSFRICWSYQ
jgi:hypothetical protein